MSKKFYITTPIYYPSAAPHLGTAYCTVMADIIKRTKETIGYDAFLLSGLDEHGEKIEKNALANNMTPQQWVDTLSVKFLSLWKTLDISLNDFIRTTQPRHVETIQSIFSDFLKNGDVYLAKYQGWYCVHEETYWTETQVGPEHLCPECGRPVEQKDEESYFFNCKKYLPFLLDFYDKNPDFITPIGRKTEMINNFIKPGLTDLSVTRTSFTWGIQVKENPKHVIYVWLDALFNYLTALGYRQKDDSNFKKYWLDPECEIVHLVGADINRFHTIYWPMFLKALNLREPNRVIVHGLMMMKDGKMSKSRGNAVPVEPLVEHFGLAGVRYYLAREILFGQDGQFTPEQFVERLNMDLANNFGNLLNRTLSMMEKYTNGVAPVFTGDYSLFDQQLTKKLHEAIEEYERLADEIKPTDAIIKVMELLDLANKYIQDSAPWTLAKDENKREELESVLSHLTDALYASAIMLRPIILSKSDELLDCLGVPEELRTFESLKSIEKRPALQTKKGAPLFPRLDLKTEVEFIKNLMAAPKDKVAA